MFVNFYRHERRSLIKSLRHKELSIHPSVLQGHVSRNGHKSCYKLFTLMMYCVGFLTADKRKPCPYLYESNRLAYECLPADL